MGKKTSVTFKNPGQSKRQTVTIAATDDNLETLTRTNYYVTPEERKVPVQYKILPNGYGYVKIATFPSPRFAPIFEQFKESIQAFVDKKVPAIIVDLRRNGGGDDAVTAKVIGFFYRARQFYLAEAVHNVDSGKFETNFKEAIWIEPQIPQYSGTVVVMVSPGTVSNGEGFAHAIQQLPQGYAVGFYGSNGAYGGTGGSVKMPKGYLVLYPSARDVDQAGKIVLESDKTGTGGVVPNFRVPRTLEKIRNVFVDGEDIELQFTTALLDKGVRNKDKDR